MPWTLKFCTSCYFAHVFFLCWKFSTLLPIFYFFNCINKILTRNSFLVNVLVHEMFIWSVFTKKKITTFSHLKIIFMFFWIKLAQSCELELSLKYFEWILSLHWFWKWNSHQRYHQNRFKNIVEWNLLLRSHHWMKFVVTWSLFN